MVMMVLTAFSSFYRFSTTRYYVGDGLSSLQTTINPMDALHLFDGEWMEMEDPIQK